MTQCWRLDDGRQTIVLAAIRTRLPQVIYWGAPLPETEDLGTLLESSILDVTGGMLDENPDLSICPEAVRSFPGQPGLIVRREDGTPLLPKFCFASQDVTNQSLQLVYEDADNDLRYTADIALDPDCLLYTSPSPRDS